MASVMVADSGAASTAIPAAKGLVLGRNNPLGQASDSAACEFADLDYPELQLLRGFADESYDSLHAEDVLNKVSKLSIALSNWIRVVQPGGRLFLRMPKAGAARRGANGDWRFTVQDPAAGERGVNLLELLQVVCHLVEVERLAVHAPGKGAAPAGDSIEVVLRKRAKPLTPVQSNNTAEVQVLAKLTRSAIAARTPWNSMAEFEAILQTGVLDATVVDISRLYLLYQWLLSTLRLPGHCIEVGSFRGGTAKLISETLLRRRVAAKLHLFDTFAGMPEQLSPDEAGLKGCFADTSVEQVRALLGNNPNVHLHPGTFPDTIPHYLNRRRFRFAHIDVDIEQSVQDSLRFIYPRLVPGGVIVIDDYGHPECPGATRAVEDFFADKPETVVQMPLVSSAVVVRSGGS